MSARWVVIAAVGWMVVAGAATTAPREYIREQRQVTVGGVTETWRLVWTGQPRPFCPVEEADMSLTCPCSGWAYGEVGKLALVRLRQGRELERLDLGGLFGRSEYPTDQARAGQGYLQRWPVKDQDYGRGADPRLIAEAKRRPVTTIMRPADYDHDGGATEFLIQVGNLACGHHEWSVVGVSKARPHLHALGSAAHPNTALLMPRHAWDALRANPRPKPVLIWECDDHGSEVRSLLEVSAEAGRIRAVDRDYGCKSAGTAGRLMKRTEW